MYIASHQGRLDVMSLLLDKGANIETKTTVSVVTSGVLNVVNEVIRVVCDDDGDE